MPKAARKKQKGHTEKGHTETRFGDRISVRTRQDVKDTGNSLIKILLVEDFSEFVNDTLATGFAQKLKDILTLRPASPTRQKLEDMLSKP